MNLSKWRRLFPAVLLDAKACPECGETMDEEYVRSPHTQGHWRGIEALVCPACGHAEYPADAEANA